MAGAPAVAGVKAEGAGVFAGCWRASCAAARAADALGSREPAAAAAPVLPFAASCCMLLDDTRPVRGGMALLPAWRRPAAVAVLPVLAAPAEEESKRPAPEDVMDDLRGLVVSERSAEEVFGSSAAPSGKTPLVRCDICCCCCGAPCYAAVQLPAGLTARAGCAKLPSSR